MHEVGQCGGQLGARVAGTDDNHRGKRRIAGISRRLEQSHNPPPDAERVEDRLEAKRLLVDAVNAERCRHRTSSKHENIPGDGPLFETERGAVVDRPALDVHGLDLADQHPGTWAQLTKRTDDVAGLDIAGGDLGKHRREQQEVLSGQDRDVGRIRKATSRLDTGIAASDDQHSGSRHGAMLSSRG